MKRVKNVLSAVAILMVASRACGASSSDGEPIVGRHSFVINGPAGGASGGMAGGPLMGNGDVGVMLSGPADDVLGHYDPRVDQDADGNGDSPQAHDVGIDTGIVHADK